MLLSLCALLIADSLICRWYLKCEDRKIGYDSRVVGQARSGEGVGYPHGTRALCDGGQGRVSRCVFQSLISILRFLAK
ncbi:hypothetical protein BX600DRAFT_181908 [Xylariales sp. PMI_506]|nr:hypothetical protein BX600DRAFT_181908 [Xylariales sp. PMI_506]